MKRLLAAAVLLLAGCATPVPARRDPLAGLSMAGAGAYKDLEIGLVLSDNTHAAAEYARKAGRFESLAAKENPVERILEGFVADLGMEFGRVTRLRSKSEAVPGLDAVAVLDVYVKYPGSIFTDAHLIVKTIFLAPDGTVLDTVQGEALKNPRTTPFTLNGPKRINDTMAWVITEARSRLKAATLGSRPLRALAAGGKPAAIAAAPAAPAAAALMPAPAPRSDVDELPAPRAARKAHAVVIGIERYREKLPAADFASGDARLAAEYFKRLGVPEANVALLTDERATRGDFEKYFERWLPNRVEAGDEVYVYFSGHGAPNPAKGDAYLVPYDGDPTYIEQTGYPLAKLYAQLSRLPAKRVIVAMDSCFSGAGGRSVIAKGARPLVAATAAPPPAKVTVLSAAAGDQISNSYQEKGRGLFTYFLLKGLKEKGADFKAAFDYLKPEVARVARREYNADQDPQWREGK